MEDALDKFKVESKITFNDIGGMADIIKQLKEMIEWPLKHSTIFEWLGVSPPKGILISGPPGSGKTLLAMAIAGQNPDINFYRLAGPEIVTGISG
jgi:ATP-dependent 26S proteasome regulatory subunit